MEEALATVKARAGLQPATVAPVIQRCLDMSPCCMAVYPGQSAGAAAEHLLPRCSSCDTLTLPRPHAYLSCHAAMSMCVCTVPSEGWRAWICQMLVEEGKVKYVGLADCTADQLRRAHAVHPISAIEVEWSLCARHNEVGTPGSPSREP